MLWRAAYCLATWLALPVVLAYFCWRGCRESAYRRGFRERLGHVGSVVPDGIWIHAASVGEVLLIAPLVDALRAAHPDVPMLFTTMTPTGRERARARFGKSVTLRYVPLDTPGATRRFMRAVRPRLAVFAETELWPNLIGAAAAADVPVALVNASISARSAERYARWPLRVVARFMCQRLTWVGTASPVHTERFRQLGVDSARLCTTGNLKYDLVAPGDQAQAAEALRDDWQAADRPIWVAASTHEGEERLLLEAFALLRQSHATLLCVIAPRHPQRFDTVHAELVAQGWHVARRNMGDAVDAAIDIVLADTLGEVPLFYAACDVAFVGGSLVPGIGGHNAIEAAALACPLAVGPYIGEWQEIVDAFIDAGAAAICETPQALALRVGHYLDDPQAARHDGAAGARVVRANSGALKRTLTMLEAVLGEA